MSYDYLFKCIIVGDSGVGKSCILMRFVDNRFQYIHELTIGVEFGSKIIQLDKHKVKIQIWDTAGQESFNEITRVYYKNCAIALVVFDLTFKKTFQNINKWLQAVNGECGKNVVFVIVGNKMDLTERRQVFEPEIRQFVNKHKFMYLETSAKNSSSEICNIFEQASKKVLQGIKNNTIEISENNGVRLGYNTCEDSLPYKNRSCCDDEIIDENCCTLS